MDMVRGKILPHRRRRELRTDYKTRLKLLRSRAPRLVVRKYLNNIQCQIIDYKPAGDVVLAAATARELKGFGWTTNTGNIPAAYLTGLLCGLRAKKTIKSAILDLGLQTSVKGARVYSALKGAIDAGLEIPHSEEILPDVGRISGKHVADYAALLKKEKPTQYKKMFSAYLAVNSTPENLPKQFEEVKSKILAGSLVIKADKPKTAVPKKKKVEE